ncbi:hypothetical protein EHQ12_11340 [Leptospira gomenensis]|uniref:Lipoprotein n=1 Tax=Leptospira gomenensis TaxID=2484974 RepID=A0A5F1YLC4_9LEPT|nr:hypothetical protein [Leptospira gomenensis]TGK33338.1 hypothetical protein EHQ17_11130 [Leptospira gomenensis]TGK37367.1 hypothetical protein EHQ12_11340 [Leptospira gomenensis]TGK40556.1 hypothetical protein EHQ07_18385 [Leptospira gomenensis]TGK56478.1 hypothetical protein EHQ13_14950 [Leptospira gomenensis]
MKSLSIILIFLCTFTFCSSPAPKRISYLSMERPKGEIRTGNSKSAEFDRFKIGFVYWGPVRLDSYLKEAEIKSGASVLRNVDLVFRAPFCILPLAPLLCFAKYSVVVGVEDSPDSF